MKALAVLLWFLGGAASLQSHLIDNSRSLSGARINQTGSDLVEARHKAPEQAEARPAALGGARAEPAARAPPGKRKRPANIRRRRRVKAASAPEFAAPIGNVTAVMGRDVRLVCTVNHLGQYQVAWLKEETKTILSIDTNIIITNYRIFLIPDEEERKWVLHIKDVQESDRGFYQCQVNTNPMRSIRGYLEVVVPPTIIETQTSQVAEVLERSSVALQCKAAGNPKPSVSWRREDGAPIRLFGRFGAAAPASTDSSLLSWSSATNRTGQEQGLLAGPAPDSNDNYKLSIMSELNDIKSEKLSFYDVDRSMAGVYICTASNGVAAQAIKRIPLFVKFAPKTTLPESPIISELGKQLDVECTVEAFPKANSYWLKTLPNSNSAQKLEAVEVWSQASAGASAATDLGGQDFAAIRGQASAVNDNSNSSLMAHEPAITRQDFSPHRTFKNKENDAWPARQFERHRGAQPSSGQFPAGNSVQDYQESKVGRGDVEPPPSASTSEHVQPGSSAGHTASNSNTPQKSLMSITHTSVSASRYKIKMRIAKIQAHHFGQYSCVASNSLGDSESHVMIIMAENQPSSPEEESRLGDATQTVGTSSKAKPYIQHSRQALSPRQRVVYDENYLQTIRKNNNNFQNQKLKLRQGPSSSAHQLEPEGIIWNWLMTCLMIVLAQQSARFFRNPAYQFLLVLFR